jgi:NTP pyrophosphatase (non-canonical NTP hydrolase)
MTDDTKKVHNVQDHPHLDNYFGKADIVKLTLNQWATACHEASIAGGWWTDLETGERKDRNVGEMFMLMVTEIAEAFNEGARKSQMDKHLPYRTALEVELADALIRIFDFAGFMSLDLDGAVTEKLAFNATRSDHQRAERMKDGGKKY